MSEDTMNGQKEVDETTTEAVPTSEKPAEQTEQTDDLPEDVSERTRLQFEKLKAQKRAVEEENALLKQSQTKAQPQYSSVLDELNPQTPAVGNLKPDQVADITQSLMDKEGYIDPDLLNKTLRDAEERAKRAEAKAEEASKRIEKFEETQIVSKVHAQFPQLDPHSPSFDPRFWELTKNEMIGQLMQGKQDYAAAAKKVSGFLNQEKVKETKVEEKQKVISQREQAAATTGAVKPNSGEYERLVDGSRAGDSLSIGQRLAANGY